MADTPGIELGALDVALRAKGADTVQKAFDEIEKAGQRAAQTTTQAATTIDTAVSALNQLGIKAKAIGGDSGAAIAVVKRNMESAESILRRLGVTAKVVDEELVAGSKTATAATKEQTAAINLELTKLQQLASQTRATSKAEVQAFQAAAVATKEMLVAQNANAAQMQRFEGIVGGVGTRVEQVGERGAHAFKMMAGNMAVLAADSGKSVRSMDALLANLSFLAFSFGPEGSIAAALTITGSVLVREFLHWRDEITETREKASEELRKLAFDADAAETESAARAQQRVVLAAQEAVGNAKLALEKVQQQVGATSVAELAARRAPDASISKLTDAENALTVAQNAMNEAMAKQRTLNALLLQQRQDEFRAQQAQLNIDRLERESADQAAAATERRRKGLQALAVAQREAFAEETKRERAMNAFAASVDAVVNAELTRQLNASLPHVKTTGKGALGIGGQGFLDSIFGEDFKTHVAETMRITGGDILAEQEKMLTDTKAQADAAFHAFGADLAGLFAESVGDAMTRGFRNVGKVMLSGLGSIFEKMGAALVKYGLTMVKLLPALHNPFTSGPAALLAGGLLIALGASLGAIAGGTGASGVGHDRAGSATVAAGGIAGVGEVTRPAGSVTVSAPVVGSPVRPLRPVQINNPVFLSERSPEFQAIIANTYDYANNRGLVRSNRS